MLTKKQLAYDCVFACTHWEALCDGDLDIEEKDPGSEPSTHSYRLLGITEHIAHTGRKQLSLNMQQHVCRPDIYITDITSKYVASKSDP